MNIHTLWMLNCQQPGPAGRAASYSQLILQVLYVFILVLIYTVNLSTYVCYMMVYATNGWAILCSELFQISQRSICTCVALFTMSPTRIIDDEIARNDLNNPLIIVTSSGKAFISRAILVSLKRRNIRNGCVGICTPPPMM